MVSKQQFATLLVGLDLSEMDDTLISYAEVLSRVCAVSHIYFVHIVRDLEIPDAVLEKFPNLKPPPPIDEGLQVTLTQKVKAVFGETKVLLEVIVKEGHPMEKFSRLAIVKDVDLILLGRKKSLKGSGIVSSKITRRSPCSLLLVPQNPPMTISKILVTVDFSGHSKLSFEAAQFIAKQTGAQIECVHIYEVPSGYHTTGKSYEEFAEIMKGNAIHDFEKFVAKGDFNEVPHCTYLLHERKTKGKLINSLAHEIHADMIVVGSRGRTAAAVMLIGSLAEKLTYLDNDIPMMIVKRKGEIMGVLEAIRRM